MKGESADADGFVKLPAFLAPSGCRLIPEDEPTEVTDDNV